MPCVYLPGPAPAVTVANNDFRMNIYVLQYRSPRLHDEPLRLQDENLRLYEEPLYVSRMNLNDSQVSRNYFSVILHECRLASKTRDSTSMSPQ